VTDESWLGSVLGTGWGGGGSIPEPVYSYLFLYILLLSIVVVLFASFAVLLNCHYPDPRVLPFSSHCPPHSSRGRGDGAATWSLGCQLGSNHEIPFGIKFGARMTTGLSRMC